MCRHERSGKAICNGRLQVGPVYVDRHWLCTDSKKAMTTLLTSSVRTASSTCIRAAATCINSHEYNRSIAIRLAHVGVTFPSWRTSPLLRLRINSRWPSIASCTLVRSIELLRNKRSESKSLHSPEYNVPDHPLFDISGHVVHPDAPHREVNL